MKHRITFILTLLITTGALFTADARVRDSGPSMSLGRNGWFAASDNSQHGHSRSSLDDVVLSEDFETIAPGFLPTGWAEVDVDSGYCTWFECPSSWEVYAQTGFSAHSGTRFAMCYYNDQALPNDDWLILPQQTLSGTITLSYWAASQDPLYPESYEVRVSTGGGSPSDFTQLIYTGTAISSDWTQLTLDLSAFAGTPFRIAFHYNAVDRFVLKLDDVELVASGMATGILAGTVQDDSAQGIPYAAVQILSLGRSTRTDSTGYYVLPRIPTGTYNVRLSHEFFAAHFEQGVLITAGDTTHLDVNLSPLPLSFRHYQTNYDPRPITDFDTTNMRLDMRDTVVIRDLDVTVTLTHTSVGDLDVWLRSPDSIWIQLAAANLSNTGQNMLNCRFDNEADLSFEAGQAPYTGHFRPVQSLGVLNGDSLIHTRTNDVRNRQWYVYVYDGATGDEGSLISCAMDVAWQTPTSVDPPRALEPRQFSFAGAYPNPFNSETRFRFTLPSAAQIELNLYNVLGQKAATVLSGRLQAGAHEVLFDASHLPAGVYFARLVGSSYSATQKVFLLK